MRRPLGAGQRYLEGPASAPHPFPDTCPSLTLRNRCDHAANCSKHFSQTASACCLGRPCQVPWGRTLTAVPQIPPSQPSPSGFHSLHPLPHLHGVSLSSSTMLRNLLTRQRLHP